MHGFLKYVICHPEKNIFLCQNKSDLLIFVFFLQNLSIRKWVNLASLKNLTFFLVVTSKLKVHISGLFYNKYQMSRCIEHEKYPKCVRPCTVVSVMDNLFVTVYIYSALLT